MPEFTLADILGAQAGAPGPVYEGGPRGNVRYADVLAALGLDKSWLDRAQKQAGADVANYQQGGVPGLLADRGETADLAGGFGGVTRDPAMWHGISQVKLPRPIAEMSAKIETQPVSETRVTPAQLQGGQLLPAIGDRSAASGTLTGFNGFEFANPVDLQGGHGYMPANTERGVVWASKPGVVSGIQKRAEALAQGGDPVYFPYTAMGERAVDFSHMPAEALIEALPSAKIARQGRTSFNEAMRGESKDFGPLEDWPGIGSKNLREYLASAPGYARNKFVKAMDTREMQEAGFPSVAEARYAVTDPRLLNEPTGASGLSISRLDMLNPNRFKPAGPQVSGMNVHADIPNQGSIESSISNPTTLKGIREIPFSAFGDQGPPKFYSATERARTQALADEMARSGYIKPLIVAEEARDVSAGPYVVEGGHRFDALKMLGKQSFPAMVVHDTTAPVASSAHRTYEAALPGQYVGGFGTSVPRELMYPDIVKALEEYRANMPAGKMTPTIEYLMSRTPKGLPIAQPANQQWVDTVSAFLRSKGLLPAAGLTLGGVLQSQTEPAPQ